MEERLRELRERVRRVGGVEEGLELDGTLQHLAARGHFQFGPVTGQVLQVECHFGYFPLQLCVARVVDLVVLERLKQLINGITEKVFFSGIDNPALVQFVQSIADATAYKVMLFGLILVVMMKVRPQGLIPAETAAQKRKA